MGFILTFPAVLGFFIGGYIYDLNPFIPWFAFGVFLLIGTFFMFRSIQKTIIKAA
jgi:hypothetical protein